CQSPAAQPPGTADIRNGSWLCENPELHPQGPRPTVLKYRSRTISSVRGGLRPRPWWTKGVAGAYAVWWFSPLRAEIVNTEKTQPTLSPFQVRSAQSRR